MDRAGKSKELVIEKTAAAFVLQPENAASIVAEFSDRDIETAVAVQVADLRIGHATEIVEDDVSGELIPAVVLQPDHFSNWFVCWEDVPENRDNQVEITVAVEIGDAD